MIKAMIICGASLAMPWVCATPLAAATYYVDFAGGDNSADGLSAQTAWKNSPGDRNATDNAKLLEVEPGDKILFKGGVAYHGAITLSVSGASNQPVTLDGNTDGTFGTGPAILDGGRVIREWRRCESAEEAPAGCRSGGLQCRDCCRSSEVIHGPR